MNPDEERKQAVPVNSETEDLERICPVCGQTLREEKCKVVCRSAQCVYRIVFNCSEF